jgi:opacity protein-like surface antigen
MRYLITFIILVFFTIQIKAQEKEKKVQYGIQGGINYSQYSPKFPFPSDKTSREGPKRGFYAGAYVTFRINERLKIQPTFNYANQGSKYRSISTYAFDGSINRNPNIEIDTVEETLVISLLLQYYLNKKLFIDAGPQLGYIMYLGYNPIHIHDWMDIFQPEEFDKHDFGFTFGLGYKITKNLGLNSRYFLGTKKRDEGVKSSVLNLGMAFNF